MKKKKPIGIVILGGLFILSSFNSFISLFTTSNRLAGYAEQHFAFPFHHYYVVQFQNVAMLIFLLITGIGLLRLSKWARFYSMVLIVYSIAFSVIYSLIYTVRHSIPYFIQTNKISALILLIFLKIIGLLLAIITLRYLNRKEIKEIFGG